MFCRHNWQRSASTRTPRFTKVPGGCSEYMAERMLMGATTIVWECIKCQKIRKEELLGWEE